MAALNRSKAAPASDVPSTSRQATTHAVVRASSSPFAVSSTKTTLRPRAKNPRIAASSQTSVATPKTTIASGSSASSSGSVFGFVKTLKFFFSSHRCAGHRHG